MLPVEDSVPNGWRRKVLFLRGVGVPEDAVLMSSISRSSMSKSMTRWTCSNWRRRSLRRSFRKWTMIWKTRNRSEGGRGISVRRTLTHLMTIPVAHTTLACCGGTMCTWPGRRLMASCLLMLNLL